MKRIQTLIILFFVTVTNVLSQDGIIPEIKDSAYLMTITRRSDKISMILGIADTTKYLRVRNIIIRQYASLNDIQNTRDEKIRSVKTSANAGQEWLDEQMKVIKNEEIVSLYQLHFSFLAKLAAEISPEQLDLVKDGMTYGVLHHTYNGYLALLPELTDEQKRVIFSNLLEARELAMDQGSSEDKHKVFGKYKGRINNYLSKEGYDLKKAEEQLKQKKTIQD